MPVHSPLVIFPFTPLPTRASCTPSTHTHTHTHTHANTGKLFMGGPAGHQFPVVHVWGTAYEMGVAQGLLLKASITAFVNQTLTYIITQARRPAPVCPRFVCVRAKHVVDLPSFVVRGGDSSVGGSFQHEHSQPFDQPMSLSPHSHDPNLWLSRMSHSPFLIIAHFDFSGGRFVAERLFLAGHQGADC
jgi:hypothetical protein